MFSLIKSTCFFTSSLRIAHNEFMKKCLSHLLCKSVMHYELLKYKIYRTTNKNWLRHWAKYIVFLSSIFFCLVLLLFVLNIQHIRIFANYRNEIKQLMLNRRHRKRHKVLCIVNVYRRMYECNHSILSFICSSKLRRMSVWIQFNQIRKRTKKYASEWAI